MGYRSFLDPYLVPTVYPRDQAVEASEVHHENPWWDFHQVQYFIDYEHDFYEIVDDYSDLNHH
jgi:hypothetical protein